MAMAVGGDPWWFQFFIFSIQQKRFPAVFPGEIICFVFFSINNRTAAPSCS